MIRVHRFAAMLGAAAMLAGAAACGSGAADNVVTTTTTTTAVEPTTDVVVAGPSHDLFCQAARDLDAMGRERAPADRSVKQVLAQNARLAELIEVVAANTPADAPPGVGALVKDYRFLSSAIVAASGDVDAAFNLIKSVDPDLAERLGLPDTYHEAVAYFADQCGTPQPGAES